MAELVQCTRCKKILVHEEYDDHECQLKIQNWKTLKFTSFYVVNLDGKKVVKILADDGTKYEFLEILENKEYTKIPYFPGSTDLRQGEKSTGFKAV